MLKRLNRRGLLYSVGILFNKLMPARLCRMRVFCVFRLAALEVSGDSPTRDDGIRFEWCDSDDQRALAQQLTYFQPNPAADSTTISPQACLAYDGDEAVGGVWIVAGEFMESELGLRIQLRPHQSWLFAACIAKSHRQRGIYTRMLQHVLRSQADREIFASINPTNKASIAAHRSMIAETQGTSFALRVFRLPSAGRRERSPSIEPSPAVGPGQRR